MAREMKDSGVEWIGEIPKAWTIRRLRYMCNIVTGNQDTQDNDPNGQYPFYVRSPIVEKSNKYTFEGPAILMSGDGAGAGRIFHMVDGKYGCHQRVYSVQDIRGIDRRMLYYYMSNLFVIMIETANSKSTVDSVRLNMLQDFPVLIPSEKEQEKLSGYLSNIVPRIDNILIKTRASIEEYKKLKQAFITQAVTKGVRGKREMRDSGIEWVGDIPKEWRVEKLRYLGVCQNGISKSSDYFGEGFPFVSYGDVYRNYQLPEYVSGLIKSTDDDRVNYSVRRGDVFFTRTSETIEEVGFSSVCLKTIENATFAGFIIRFRPNGDELLPEYSKYYFRSDMHRRFFVKEMNLVTRASLGQELLKKMPIIIPSFQEQMEIAAYLEKQCGEIDNIIMKKEQYITEIENYKKSLIYEYVTGKKEVPQKYQV